MLVELAARDDPPMVIDEPLRARLARAGIDLLEPLLGPWRGVEVADTLDELEQVEALYFAGPGLSSRMPLGDQPTPVAVALERILAGAEPFVELRRFRLAAIDMRLVGQRRRACSADGAARSFDRMLETALVVTYARYYLRGRLRVPGGWEPRQADRDLHCHVVRELRTRTTRTPTTRNTHPDRHDPLPRARRAADIRRGIARLRRLDARGARRPRAPIGRTVEAESAPSRLQARERARGCGRVRRAP